nr:MAG TPA: Membrane MotB of proton-channel complex MotA/MotB [Caudoviricetes sp.]
MNYIDVICVLFILFVMAAYIMFYGGLVWVLIR